MTRETGCCSHQNLSASLGNPVTAGAVKHDLYPQCRTLRHINPIILLNGLQKISLTCFSKNPYPQKNIDIPSLDLGGGEMEKIVLEFSASPVSKT